MNFDFGFDYNVPYSLPAGTSMPTFSTGGGDFGSYGAPNPDLDTSFGIPQSSVGQTFANASSAQSEGNFLDRLGSFARDITPLLYGAGSIIEGIRGVPRNQSRFAGFNQGVQLDMLARSLGYNDGRELIESGKTGVKPPKPGEQGGSVIKPSVPPVEDLTKFRGTPEEGAAQDGKTLGLSAVLRGANEYGISPREFVEMGRQRGYEFGPEAMRQLSTALSSQGLNQAN